jgi:hypothetical protein
MWRPGRNPAPADDDHTRARDRGTDRVYCASLFSGDGLAGSLRRPETGPNCPLPESRPCSKRTPACDARAFTISTLAIRAPRGAPQSSRTRAAGVASHPGAIKLFSILVGFGVVTLFATGFLFVAHMLEDFRDA